MVDAMKVPTPKFVPQVFHYRDDDNSLRFAIVFRKGRTMYHMIAATCDKITSGTVATLRDFKPALMGDGTNYPVKKCASFWLNHDHRPITTRARAVLKGLVARKPKGLDSAAGTG